MVEERTIFGMKRLLRAAPSPLPLRKRFHLPLALSAWRGRKVRTPIPLDPERVRDKQESFAGLIGAREATVAFIESTRGTDVSIYRFEHPFLGSLDMYAMVPHRSVTTNCATRNKSVNLRNIPRLDFRFLFVARMCNRRLRSEFACSGVKS